MKSSELKMGFHTKSKAEPIKATTSADLIKSALVVAAGFIAVPVIIDTIKLINKER